MLLYHVPSAISRMFPQVLWHGNRNKPTLYLTFDDGPHPDITPWVLEQLENHNAKATFFCVGQNAEKYPEEFQNIRNGNHNVGNHTFNHLNGWKTTKREYLENVNMAQELHNFQYFRPPYGKMGLNQYTELKTSFQITMWDVLTGDFNKTYTSEDCFNHTTKHTHNGSILVLHDSEKAWPRLQKLLPRILEHYSKLGFKFEGIEGI
jgi:peptidoglycan/xylan/chitin deacetylase (PgdA/CDA1 family)